MHARGNFVGKRHAVVAAAAAGGAGDDFDELLFQPAGAQNIVPCIDFAHGVGGERHADGIADAAKEERADAAAALDEPRPLGARLRHADVEGIVRPLRKQFVSLHGEGHVGRLDGDDDVLNAVLFQNIHVIKRAFNEGAGAPSVLFQKVRLDAARIRPHAHGDMMRLDAVRDEGDLLLPADVARVDAQLVRAPLHRHHGKAGGKVDVGNDRHTDARLDEGQRSCVLLVGDGNAHDIAPRFLKAQDLGGACFHAARLFGGHALDGNGRAAPDRDSAHHHASGRHISSFRRAFRPSAPLPPYIPSSAAIRA